MSKELKCVAVCVSEGLNRTFNKQQLARCPTAGPWSGYCTTEYDSISNHRNDILWYVVQEKGCVAWKLEYLIKVELSWGFKL